MACMCLFGFSGGSASTRTHLGVRRFGAGCRVSYQVVQRQPCLPRRAQGIWKIGVFPLKILTPEQQETALHTLPSQLHCLSYTLVVRVVQCITHCNATAMQPGYGSEH